MAEVTEDEIGKALSDMMRSCEPYRIPGDGRMPAGREWNAQHKRRDISQRENAKKNAPHSDQTMQGDIGS